MALTITVAALDAAIRARTDNEGTSALDRFSTAEVLTYINRAVQTFWRVMVESRAGNFKVSTTTVPTVSGTSVYALDATFYRLLNVNVTANGRKTWITPFDENERAALSDTNAGWIGVPFHYSLVGSNIEFLPTPGGVYSVEVRFVPDPPTLVAGNSFDCVNSDAMNFIIDTAAKFLADKDENWELSAMLKASTTELQQALIMSLPSRDQNFPPRIQDIRQASTARRSYRRLGRA